VLSRAVSIASSIYNVIMSLIISIYMLSDKEKLGILLGKLLYCFMSRKRALKTVSFAIHLNEVFENYFTGKLVDSFIIAVIFFVGAALLKLPYPLFFALIIGITNMIPYFGPVIGGVPVVMLTLIYSPIKGLWVLLFIIVLQQFDGVILGPKILGNSIGIKPLGVIFAIIVGGAIAGPVGMFFGVPIFSVLAEVVNDFIEKNYYTKTIMKSNEKHITTRYARRQKKQNVSINEALPLLDTKIELPKILEAYKPKSQTDNTSDKRNNNNRNNNVNNKKNNNGNNNVNNKNNNVNNKNNKRYNGKKGGSVNKTSSEKGDNKNENT
jgi:hypothetical protein